MPPLPSLTAAHALFLDFDGTLTELALRPESVRIDPALVPTLARLHARLEGALAIVTGRREADIDDFLAPLRLPLASEHGAQYRWGDISHPAVRTPDLTPVLVAAQALVAQFPGLLIEPKRASLALHYRLAPELEAVCRATLELAMQSVDGVELLPGKCVFEVKPRGSHKGQAITDFMQQPAFAGRIPVFAGDDTTDEAGFAAVQALGGWGIKIGPGASLAQQRCPDAASLRAWLREQLAGPLPLPTAAVMPAAFVRPPPADPPSDPKDPRP